MGWWTSIRFWERIDTIATYATVLSALLAVIDRMFGAIWGSGWGLVLLLAKGRLKRLEALAKQHRLDLSRRMLKRVLDQLRADYFKKVVDAEMHHHRVTLFICERTVDEQQKRLAIYARTGVFEASTCALNVDDNEEEKCEGVAGRIWFGASRETVLIGEWPDDPNDVDKKAVYANQGYLSAERAEQLHIKSEAFTGKLIRVFGRKWGVLLLDSRKAGYIEAKPHKLGLLRKYANLIGRLLEECQE